MAVVLVINLIGILYGIENDAVLSLGFGVSRQLNAKLTTRDIVFGTRRVNRGKKYSNPATDCCLSIISSMRLR